MGSTDRFLFKAIEPRPVWVDLRGSLGHGPVLLGLLVEWRCRERPGRPPRWEGLVVSAVGGGELPWSLSMRWIGAEELHAVEVEMPAELARRPPRPPDRRRRVPGS